MIFYFFRQVLLAIPALLGVLIITFLLMRAVPGDVVTQLVGIDGNVSVERMEEMRRMFGLDLPVHQQLAQWIGAALQGDLGSSLRTNRPILQDLALRFPVTLELTILSLIVALLIAIPLGVLAALHRGKFLDSLISSFALLGLSIPGFFLGILLILLFSLRLGLLPPAGYVPLQESIVENLRHMILPSVSLGLVLSAAITRIVRSSMLEILGRDYVRTARAKGLREEKLVRKYPVKIALNPLISNLGLLVYGIVAQQGLIGIVLGLPTLGPLLLNSLLAQDMILAGTILLIYATLIWISTLVSDVLLAWFDPRIRFEGSAG